MGTKGVGTFLINSVFASGNLVFYEKTVGRTATGDVFTIGTAAVKVGGTGQDVDFQVYGTGSLSAIIDIGAATFILTGITMSFAGSGDVDLPANSVDKADLATEVYTIEHITMSGNTNDFDSETIKLTELWSAGTVVKVAYFTNAALGTNLGIDILDGGTDGSGTDVIDSCSDNLNGSDVNNLTTPYALSAGDYINVKFDDVTNDVSFTIDIQVKVPVGAAT